MIIIIKKNIQVNLRMPSKQIDGLKFNKKKNYVTKMRTVIQIKIII